MKLDEEDKEGEDSEEVLLMGGDVEQKQGMFYKKCIFNNEKERARAIMDALSGFGNKKIY